MPLPLYYFLSITAINVLMSWALYLPYRIAQLHFLTVAVMAVSGYAAGYLVTACHAPFALALAVGFALGGIIGSIVALFTADAPMFAVVIVGFTFIYLTRTVIENMEVLGGTLGLFGLPNLGGSPDAHRWIILSILAALMLVAGFSIHRFDRSSLGRAASVVFADRDLASSLGIDRRRLGMMLQTAACVLAGGCGVLYGFIYKSFSLGYFTFGLVGTFLTTLFVGGRATQWGSLIAAPILYGLPLLLPPQVASMKNVIYGALLVLVILVKPEGLVSLRLVHSMRNWHIPRKKE